MEPIEIFIPLRVMSGYSNKRLNYIKKVREFIPNIKKESTKRQRNLPKYHCQIDFYIEGKHGGNSSCDLDNMLKAILDSMTGRIFWDDSQIISLKAKIHENSEKIGTKVLIGII